jgi:hypothetical protein
MNLVMTLIVRDEDDILEANLDYHLCQGVDHVLVIDHEFKDATPEILDRYSRAGCLHVIRELRRRVLELLGRTARVARRRPD